MFTLVVDANVDFLNNSDLFHRKYFCVNLNKQLKIIDVVLTDFIRKIKANINIVLPKVIWKNDNSNHHTKYIEICCRMIIVISVC